MYLQWRELCSTRVALLKTKNEMSAFLEEQIFRTICVPCYLIAHDAPDMDSEACGAEEKLSQTLSELGGRRIQHSVWLIRVKERDANRVISGLRPYVESDLLWVSEVNSNYGYNRALTGTNSWLIENGV